MNAMLPNRVAIITGGARGIGRAIARKFAEEGCSTVIADERHFDALKRSDGYEIVERDSTNIEAE